MGCRPVAMVIMHVHKCERRIYENLSREGHKRSMQWQLGVLGTITAFAYRHRETEKITGEGGIRTRLYSTLD